MFYCFSDTFDPFTMKCNHGVFFLSSSIKGGVTSDLFIFGIVTVASSPNILKLMTLLVRNFEFFAIIKKSRN